MSLVTDMMATAEEQLLDAIRQTQDITVEMVRTWAESVESLVPSTAAVPFADQLPTASELVEHYFGFSEKLLASQREFANNLLAAAAPVLAQPQPNVRPVSRPAAVKVS